MISLEGVYARYKAGKFVLNGVTVNFNGKDIILGPNGSGKTTLFRVILGLSVNTRGTVRVDGEDLTKIVGRPNLISTNIEDVYRLLSIQADGIARLYIESMRGDYSLFAKLADELDLRPHLRKKLHELSAGQRKIFCNLVALSSNAKYILLDEPFESLDPARRAKLSEIMLQMHEKIIMNTHATWLLDRFSGWTAHLMVDGRAYGPTTVGRLLASSIAKGEASSALLSFEVGGVKYSLVEGVAARTLSAFDTLDKLYEVIM